jgi:hypothetical protein
MVSTHFDSDSGGNRAKESDELVKLLDMAPFHNAHVCRSSASARRLQRRDTDTGGLKSRLVDQAGFKDVLRDTGNGGKITHPWSNTYNSNSMWGAIDHIMARGAAAAAVASVSSKVHDGGLFVQYPDGVASNEVPRICSNFDKKGADHFAVEGVISFA